MTDVPAIRAALPANVASAVSLSAPAPTATLVTVSGGVIPAALAQLAIGAVINGTIAERGPRGLVVIRTDKGSISLQTPLPLRIGAAVTLQIQSLGAQSQVMILSVDGQPLAGQAAATLAVASNATKPPTIAGGAQPQGKALPLADLASKAATAQAATAQPAATQLRPGVLVSGSLTPHSVSAANPSLGATPAPQAAAAVQPETEQIAVRVLGIAAAPARPPGNAPVADVPMPRSAPGIVAADDAVTFAATVVASTPEDAANITLLRTPFGLLRLPLPVSEPVGSQLLLELLTQRGPAATPADRIARDLGASRRMISLGQEWPALRDVAAALEADAPEVAQQTMATAVPRVGPTLAAGMLLFIAAARSGNLRQWLGDQTIDNLERAGHGALVNRLADDVANLPRLAETQANGWQTLLLPVFDGEKLRQIRMSMRRAQKEQNGDRKDGARFIIEAELSKLGALQLDGLVRLPHFDLAVRSKDNLPPDIRANIMEIFNDAMQATRLTGSVVFQVARDLRPGPFENWQASGPGVTV